MIPLLLVVLSPPERAAAAPRARVGVKSLAAAGSARDDAVRTGLEQFARRNRGRKSETALAELLEQVSTEVPEFRAGGDREDARLKCLRLLAATTGAPIKVAAPKSRYKRREVSGGSQPAGPRDFPLPTEIMYRFGERRLQPISKDSRRLKTLLRKKDALAPTDLTAENRLGALLRGCLPETEFAIARIQQELDVLDTADQFAHFLDSWRNYGPNGDESFYEALDRTAGTPEAVFFYDAMLAEFVHSFAPREGKLWSLPTQYEHTQQSFLSYRQYRGLVEAAAYCLALPPDIDLPARLARYDYAAVGEGLLSLRHQIDLLVRASGGDVGVAMSHLRDFLKGHPLPHPLWESYDPMSVFWAEIQEQVGSPVQEPGQSTQDAWRIARDARLALGNAVRKAVGEALSKS